jgi:hypothetical protein
LNPVGDARAQRREGAMSRDVTDQVYHETRTVEIERVSCLCGVQEWESIKHDQVVTCRNCGRTYRLRFAIEVDEPE